MYHSTFIQFEVSSVSLGKSLMKTERKIAHNFLSLLGVNVYFKILLCSRIDTRANCLCEADNMFILLHVRVTLSSYNVLFISGHKHLKTMHCVEKGLQIYLLEKSGEDYSCQQKIYSMFSCTWKIY